MKTVSVNTPSKTYPVEIGQGLLEQAGHKICQLHCKNVMVVTDSHVAPLYGQKVLDCLKAAGLEVSQFVFPAGEGSKCAETLLALLNEMAACHFTRSDAVVALGGGVVGDLAGLAASLYMRGMKLVQLPTTLLSAVDSSVGGKTAIDLPAGKNLVGTFYQPDLVLCDIDTLTSLPAAEIANGQAEVIKYAFLKDASILELLHAHENLEDMIARCVAIKRDVVCADERESGLRQLLNFGHTFAHSIEQNSGYTIPHGSAVAVGMVLITRAAVKKGLCDASCLKTLLQVLDECHLPVSTEYSPDALFATVLSDKKRAADSITLVVPRKIGLCELQKVSLEDARTFLQLGMTGEGV